MEFRWVTIFLDFPGAAFEAGTEFWREVTGCALSPARGPTGEFATLLPPDGDACMRVQRIADGDGGCHLDLHVDLSSRSLAEAAAGAAALGARMHDREDDEVIVLDSPGGFTFCVVPWEGERVVPGPVGSGSSGGSGGSGGSGSGGSGGADASRADQLCLDIPPADYEREISFWAALTGWELRGTVHPEFACLQRPAGMPVRLLLQRRDAAAAGDRVTAHVDFATSRRPPVTAAHVAAGARVAAEFPGWTVMTDPTGRPYCLTARPPA